MNTTTTNVSHRRGSAAPICDRVAGTAYVPLFASAGFVTLDIEDFETLSKREDLVLSPLALGRHYGVEAVRARYRDLCPDGFVHSQPMADLLVRPGQGFRVVLRDGDPLNLRRSNLLAVRVQRANPVPEGAA